MKRFKGMIRPEAFPTPFCSGCGHGILMQCIFRAIQKTGLDMDKMLFASGIGCAAWIPSPHFNADTLHVTHGRSIAFATGAKAVNPSLTVMVISGDGDLASIGGNHLIHAARRQTDMLVVCANNFIYGMTGGQVAATTPHACCTATTPEGNPDRPFNLAGLVWAAGADYVARASVADATRLTSTLAGALLEKGFRFIEVLSTCPTEYGKRAGLGNAFSQLEYLKEISHKGSMADEFAGKTTEGTYVLGEIKRSGS